MIQKLWVLCFLADDGFSVDVRTHTISEAVAVDSVQTTKPGVLSAGRLAVAADGNAETYAGNDYDLVGFVRKEVAADGTIKTLRSEPRMWWEQVLQDEDDREAAWLQKWHSYSNSLTEVPRREQAVSACGQGLVIGAGMGRTGTTTMADVLKDLGYNAIHGFQQVYPDQIYEFIKDPEHVATSNVFADLVNQTGVPHDAPYFWWGKWPPKGTAFVDVPFFGMACELHKRYPEAKFFYIDRPADEHAKSVMAMNCHFDCKLDPITKTCTEGHCARPPMRELRTFLWGEAYGYFCDNAYEICRGAPSSHAHAHLHSLLVQRHEEHKMKVRGCIAKDALYDKASMFTSSFEAMMEQFLPFLSCASHTPMTSRQLNVRAM